MLQYKINYILAKKSFIMSAIADVLKTKIAVYGKTDTNLYIYTDMILYAISLNILGYNQKLELYKRLINILRKMGIQLSIPTKENIDFSDMDITFDSTIVTFDSL